MKSLVWFRRDLRVHDNPALFHAAEQARDGVLGLFVVTPGQWREHEDSNCKIHFWLRNLKSLSESLARLRIPLLVATCDSYGDVAREVLAIAQEHRCSRLLFNREYEVNEARRDAAVETACREAGISVERFHDRVIVPPAEIKTKEGRFYSVFTPYRRVWDAAMEYFDEPLPAPSQQRETGITASPVPTLLGGFEFSEACRDRWPAGEAEAQSRLNKFLKKITAYNDQRDVPSVNGTSLLSPHLAAGVISPRQCVTAALSSAGGELSGNAGARTWVSELTWRDFYTHVLVGFRRVSMHQPFKEKTNLVQWRTSDSDFAAWCDGQTGYPIVDAGMRQLNQTGWMHNRLRMVTAMFLTKHLLIDWRWGERYFMNKLIDGDLAANNGGWQWSASTGTDAVPYFRIFNPFSQGKRFDPDGVFIKKFCPELSSLTSGALHDPKKLTEGIAGKNVDYPSFVVDYKAGRERALAEFKRVSSL